MTEHRTRWPYVILAVLLWVAIVGAGSIIREKSEKDPTPPAAAR